MTFYSSETHEINDPFVAQLFADLSSASDSFEMSSMDAV